MRLFHISDVLSATTGRLVSNRHVDGLYDILNFLTGDNLFTHQLPRAMTEAKPWLASQFPFLMPDHPEMASLMDALSVRCERARSKEELTVTVSQWVENVRLRFDLPEMIAVYEMPKELHTAIDPVEELCAMVGDDKVIVVERGDGEA